MQQQTWFRCNIRGVWWAELQGRVSRALLSRSESYACVSGGRGEHILCPLPSRFISVLQGPAAWAFISVWKLRSTVATAPYTLGVRKLHWGWWSVKPVRSSIHHWSLADTPAPLHHISCFTAKCIASVEITFVFLFKEQCQFYWPESNYWYSCSQNHLRDPASFTWNTFMNLYWINISTGVREPTVGGSGVGSNAHFFLASFVLFFLSLVYFLCLCFCFFCIETPFLNWFCFNALNPESMVLKPSHEWRLEPIILTLKPQFIRRTEWISFNVKIWETYKPTIWVSIL